MFIAFKITLLIIQLTALGYAMYYWKYYKNSSQKFFLHFIVFSIVIDQVSTILSIYFDQRVSWLYNILIIVSGLFYLFWFNKIIKEKKVTTILTFIFVIYTLFSVYMQNITNVFYSNVLTLETIIILICSTLFFSELIKSAEVENYLKSQKFWFVVGILIFHFGFLPIHLLLTKVYANTIEYKTANLILNLILYGCYVYGFLISKKKSDDRKH